MKSKSGFSIVEVTIVVAVVAILASISTIAYLSIQREARDGKRESNITILAEALEKYYEQNGEYPSCTMLSESPDTISADTLPGIQTSIFKAPQADNGTINSITCDDLTEDTDEYAYLGDGTEECNTGIACQGWVLRYKKEASNTTVDVKSRHGSDLAGHTPPALLVDGSAIQDVTQAQCQMLPIYNGTNSDAIRTVTDARGGTTRSYDIARLGDNKCWMLSNLKLGGGSAITLTPSDSNVGSTFILPALTDMGPTTNDDPRVYGPVTGDTGSGSTNYGYLYNFPAATAGETRATLPSGGVNHAQYSICPANWQLPTSGSANEDFGQLDIAFGGTGLAATGSEPNIALWQPGGVFQSTFSGTWVGNLGGFTYQGTSGSLWSRSAYSYPGFPDSAHGLALESGRVRPSAGFGRDNPIGIRCLRD